MVRGALYDRRIIAMNAVVARNGRDTTSYILDNPVPGQIDLTSQHLAGFDVKFKLFDDTEIAPPSVYHWHRSLRWFSLCLSGSSSTNGPENHLIDLRVFANAGSRRRERRTRYGAKTSLLDGLSACTR